MAKVKEEAVKVPPLFSDAAEVEAQTPITAGREVGAGVGDLNGLGAFAGFNVPWMTSAMPAPRITAIMKHDGGKLLVFDAPDGTDMGAVMEKAKADFRASTNASGPPAYCVLPLGVNVKVY